MKRIPKTIVQSARERSKARQQEIGRRFDQLVVKGFVRDKLDMADEDAEYSEPEAGDEAYAKELKEQDPADIEANNGQLGKQAMAALEEKRAQQAQQAYDAEHFVQDEKEPAKKKVKRILWNTPFDFKAMEQRKPTPKQDPSFLAQTREEVLFLQRKEALAVPTATKYRPRDVQLKKDKGVIKIKDTPIGREQYQVFVSPCVTSVE